MKAFRYLTPASLDDAVALLSKSKKGETMLLAGGQDLLTEMKEHLAEPGALVNLKALGGLDAVEVGAQRTRIGALATLATLERHAVLAQKARVLVQAAASIASPQIRSCGTLGGNLCQRPRCPYFRMEEAKCLKKGGDTCFAYEGFNKYAAVLGGGPSYIVHPSDLAPALVALGAEIALRSSRGERRLALEDFYVLPGDGDVTRETVREHDEVVTEVAFPTPSARARSTYLKFKERESYDFALAAVAAVVEIDGGVVTSARVCLGGVAPVPWRSHPAESALVGKPLDAGSARAAAEAAFANAEALEHNGYKIPLGKELVARALSSLA